MAGAGGAGFRTRVADGVLRIALGQGRHNTMTAEMMEALAGTVAREAGAPGVRALVVSSDRPGVFSLGIEPTAIVARPLPQRKAVFHAAMRAFREILAAPVPTFAAVAGDAYAGGAVLAAVCDYRLMAPSAKISFSESKVGVALPAFLTAHLAQTLHQSSLVDVVALGRALDGPSAAACGLATHICPSEDDMEAIVADRTAKASRMSRKVLSATLHSMKARQIEELEQFIDTLEPGKSGEWDEFLGDDFLGEGLAAYMEKRPPVWKR